MKLSYKLSNVLGSIYHDGSLEYTAGGDKLYSPVGNKVVCYDLKHGTSSAVPVELEYNIHHVACAPNSSLLLLATEKTQLYVYSLVANKVLHRKHFHDLGTHITALGFSPCGKYYVVCGGSKALVYITPGTLGSGNVRSLSPFQIHKVIKAHFDDTTSFSFSSDSRLLAVGSKDFTVKISTVDTKIKNIAYVVNLAGHSDTVVSVYFATDAKDSLDIYSLGANGHLIVWESTISSDQLVTEEKKDEENEKLNYTKKGRHYLLDHLKSTDKNSNIKLTCSDYSRKTRLLTTGYSNGCFLIQSAPEFTIIYSLQLSTSSPLNSIKINSVGEWIAIGSPVSEKSSSSQLVVWEWKSETFLLKQSGSGAGVVNLTEVVTYSPDAGLIASGSTDGKIKLWNISTGFNVATFSTEHRGPVTALKFAPNKSGKVLVSASLDGTVRCFDMGRYRNFRTFTGPSEERMPQFISLAIDSLSGEFIAAGSQNLFDIFLWSQETGKLLEVLTGHSAPVSGLQFSPNDSLLISTSWDSTLRIWTLFQGTKSCREVIKLSHPGLSLAINTAGDEVAASLFNGNIVFFNPVSGEEIGSAIEGRNDLGSNQEDADISLNRAKHFTTLDYSVDGQYILAAGNSKYICMYHVTEKLLVKKFAITWNLSMDGMYDYISKRKRAEFGFNLAQIKERDQGSDGNAIALPGVRRGDLSERNVNPVIMVTCLQFSPTMRSFTISSSEGIFVFSLDVGSNFDPYELDINITEDSVREALESNDLMDALMQALKLNQETLTTQVLESVPIDQIPFISSGLSINYLEKCLKQVAVNLESSRHLEFYLVWINQLLKDHAVSIKSNHSERKSLVSILRLVQKNIMRHQEDIGKLCDMNKYTMRMIIEVSRRHRVEEQVEEMT